MFLLKLFEFFGKHWHGMQHDCIYPFNKSLIVSAMSNDDVVTIYDRARELIMVTVLDVRKTSYSKNMKSYFPD